MRTRNKMISRGIQIYMETPLLSDAAKKIEPRVSGL